MDEAIEKLKEVKIDAERKQKVRRRWREGRRGGHTQAGSCSREQGQWRLRAVNVCMPLVVA